MRFIIASFDWPTFYFRFDRALQEFYKHAHRGICTFSGSLALSVGRSVLALACIMASSNQTVTCPPPLKPAAEKAILTPKEMEAAIPAVFALSRAHFTSQCLYTVVVLGVPDVIGSRTLSVAEIVSSLGCPVPKTYC